MRNPRHSAALRGVLGIATLASLFLAAIPFAPISAAEPARVLSGAIEETTNPNQGTLKAFPDPAVKRWSDTQPGCSFSRGRDGKYSYGMWVGDVGVVMAVDAREVQVVRHRIEPIFGVLLTVRYRGSGSLDESPDGITLQFVKHFKVVQPALDPDSYSRKTQEDAETVDDETRRAIKKHPDQKQARIKGLQGYQEAANELIEFLNSHSLRPAHLDRATPQALGWVFFDTDTKWIGSLKEQEEFVLRFPLAGKIFEFPFKLPPEPGELLLRRRQ